MKMRKNRWRLLAAFLSFFIVVSLPKPVKAITTGSRLLNDHPVEPSGDFISINVDGIIENQSNHQISIPFIDFSLNQAKTISQKALLETISNRLHESELNHNFEVIGFTPDSLLSDGNKNTYSLQNTTIHLLPSTDIQQRKYSLTGHVLLKEKTSTITEVAHQIKLAYTAEFMIEDPETGRLRHFSTYDNSHLDTVPVGKKISSADLLSFAQELMTTNANLQDYEIIKRQKSHVTYDHNNHNQLDFANLYDPQFPQSFFYEAKNRQAHYTSDKAGNNKVLDNTDYIYEQFVIAPRKQSKPYIDESQKPIMTDFIVHYQDKGQIIQTNSVAIDTEQGNWLNQLPYHIMGKNGKRYTPIHIYRDHQKRVLNVDVNEN